MKNIKLQFPKPTLAQRADLPPQAATAHYSLPATRYCFVVLLAFIIMFPASVMAADEAKVTVKLDGKTLFVPELQLTRKINPVTSVLYMGSWGGVAKLSTLEKPLGVIDSKNNSLILRSPENLLEESKPRVLKRDALGAYLDGINWNNITWKSRQATQFAFKAISSKRQPAVLEIYAQSDAVVFLDGKPAGSVTDASVMASGGRGFFPVMLEKGGNIISIKQYSSGEPRIEVSVLLDHSHDLQAAWQSQNGLLKKLILRPEDRAVVNWSPGLGRFCVSAEVRDLSADKIVIQKNSLYRGMSLVDDGSPLAPGVYKAVYRVAQNKGSAETESAAEVFIVGNPKELFAGLSERLSNYNVTLESKLDIEAQLRRGKILLADNNSNMSDRQWQEKVAYTFSSLVSMERRLAGGATDIAKDQPGLHIRGFASKIDGGAQFYRLFVPSTYKPGEPLPLLVFASTRVASTGRPFIEGPVMANHREALLWAKSAEKHGFAILWPGYRGAPNGYTYESVHVEEALQAVEQDYNIDKQQISVYATCGAGYNAGRMISEYPSQFAAIVYDRAVFDVATPDPRRTSPAWIEWLKTVNPVPRVLGNHDLKIFVMHDNTSPPGHGPMALTTKFLAQALGMRYDVVSYLGKRPMSEIERMDMVFSWLAPCRNPKPGDMRSHFLDQSGYQGPIMEIFATPIIIVEGSHAGDNGRKVMREIAESIRSEYKNYFHGAECVIKKDDAVTPDDIINHSLVLVGNPQYNSVWADLQPEMPLKTGLMQASYKDKIVARNFMFEAIVRHPAATDKYILMIGTGDVKNLQPIPAGATNNLFNAWYDCRVFSKSQKSIGKLDALQDEEKIKPKDED